jgi:alpha-N-arabinofuranosidase
VMSIRSAEVFAPIGHSRCGSIFTAWVAILFCTPLASAQSMSNHQITETRPSPSVVSIQVDATSGKASVPAELFGGFLEPIGNSINNGLSAQILVNPSLERGLWNDVNLRTIYQDEPELLHLEYVRAMPVPWMPWDKKAGNRYEVHAGQAANSYLSVELLGTPDAPTGLMERIYLPVHRTRSYRISTYARRIAGKGELTFAFRLLSGEQIATAAVQTDSSEWKKYVAELVVPEGTIKPLEKVEFGVYVKDDSRVEIDQLSLLPSDARNGLDPDAVKFAKAMGMTELRLGGNFSSYYHWRDGIGDPDKRLAMINIAWGIPEYNNFGTDEFLALCRELNVVPQIDINMGSGTPDEASKWVHYIRQHYKGRVLWEIGNELWGQWQVGPPTLAQLPERTLAFSKAVRSAEPGAEIISTGETPQKFEKWHAALLTLPPKSFDNISIHFVETSGRDKTWLPLADDSAYMVYAKSYHVGETFSRMQEQVNTTSHRDSVHFAMTEWLFNSMGQGQSEFTNDYPAWINQGGAVAAAGFFNTLLQHSDVVKIADMTGMMEFAGILKRRERVYVQPAYYVFQMYAAVKGEALLPVTTDSGAYRVIEKDYAFAGYGDVPYVDVVGTISKDTNRVTLFVVNRSKQRTEIKLAIKGFSPRSVERDEISARDRYERNTEQEPDHIHPVSSNLSPGEHLSLPGESVARITLSR